MRKLLFLNIGSILMHMMNVIDDVLKIWSEYGEVLAKVPGVLSAISANTF